MVCLSSSVHNLEVCDPCLLIKFEGQSRNAETECDKAYSIA